MPISMEQKEFNCVLRENLRQAVTPDDTVCYIKTGRVQKAAARALKKLRRQYKQLVLHGEKDEFDSLLLEHYYLIEREGKALLKDTKELYLPAAGQSEAPDIIRIVRFCMEEPGFVFDTDSVSALISAFESVRKIKSFELEYLLSAMKAAAIQLLAELIQREQTESIPAQQAISALFAVKTIDMAQLLEWHNHLDHLLTEEICGCYDKMNDITQELYRYKLCMTAIHDGKDELELAKEYLERSAAENRHIGFFIYEAYDRLFCRKTSSKCYIPLMLIAPAVLAVLCGVLCQSLWLPFLLYFPIWAIIKPAVDYFCLLPVKSEYLPRMELNGSIPEKGRTLIAIATLLPNAKEIMRLREKLEKIYRTNCFGDVRIVLLADLKENRLPSTSDDQLLIRLTQKMIQDLNHEFENHFLLLVRKRSYSKTQRIYTGRERKRGAVDTLIGMIMGHDAELEAFEGDRTYLLGVKYLYILDYDTKALMDTAEQLVSIALHPLNQPVIDEEKGVVRQGYGIFAPRVGVDLKESLKTPFAKIMGGLGGISAYDKGCGDLYQDLFGEGIFAGKGLIDVSLFYRLLKDRFPEEVVLSHDILEGSFLRTAFVSDVELLDGFPQSASSYYKRLHRWIRGDFQNIPYLFSWIQTPAGKAKNPLNGLSRFKLFDNLRRELNPFLSLTSLLLSLLLKGNTGAILAAAGILAVVSGHLFGLVWSIGSGGLFSLSRKYYSGTLPQSFELLSQCFYELILLPKTAINAIDAVMRALYRRFVSHRNLMEWTTAAQAERRKNSFWQVLAGYWCTCIPGFLLLLWGRGFVRLTGLLFLFAVPVVLYSQRKYHEKTVCLTDAQTDALLSAAASMWEFYQDFANESENWLPPDNVQESPVYHTAHRTSPTNIGMLLLSALSARDLELIDTAVMVRQVTNTITTVEKLKKFHGNLYNWYSTRDLEVLKPQYVSTVDSGNFVCCLVALKEGMKEYRGESTEIEPLIDRIVKLIDQTDLSIFYDKSKRLFSIGYDSRTGKLSDSSYDMLMSEARMTSYYAIAKRQVPLKHWSALGRTLARHNFYTGPISWTGTMFEYFMPELLLHCIDGSLGYEGLRFCLYCQKRRARQKGVPFGISESGYYAFDSRLNYQYQAFGVQKLALKKGQNLNTVISPYSSFLVLPYDFEAAYRNLYWLKRIGAFGKYGFYEAVDFTAGRVMDSPYQIVKSYMAHHVGMSMISVNNVLNHGVMQRRFLRDREMNRANELLQEKVMTGSTVYRDIDGRELVRRSPREESVELEYSNINPQSPRAGFLSNGETTSILTDCGASFIKYQQKDLTRRTTDLLRRPTGIFAYAKCEAMMLPFCAAPDYDNRFYYQVKFGANSVSYITTGNEMEVGMKVSLHPVLPCEQRQLVVCNLSSRKKQTELMIYLEPVLDAFRDDAAHPAFSKLFLQVRYDRVSNTLIISRRERSGKGDPIFMAVGFLEDFPFEYETNRENVLTRPYGIFSLKDAFEKKFCGGNGTPDPCLAVRWKASVPPKSQHEFTLVLSSGRSENQAVNGIIAMRSEGMLREENAAHPIIPIDSIEGRIASVLLPRLLYRKPDSSLIPEAVSQIQAAGINHTALWQYGISGDFPIVLVELQSEKETERVKNYISCQKRMNMCHLDFDLVFAFDEEEDYHQPILRMVREQAERLGQSGMLDAACGIHLVNIMAREEIRQLLRAAACHIAPKSMVRLNKPAEPYTPLILLPAELPQDSKGTNRFENEKYVIECHPKLPWSHVLASPAFGTLLSDCSLGYTWAMNSRENKLTPWYNDTMSDNHGELIVLHMEGNYYNLASHARTIFSPHAAIYEGGAKGVRYSVTVTVPPKGMVKQIEVVLKNQTERRISVELAYYTEPVLGVDRSRAGTLHAQQENNLLLFRNSFWQTIPARMGIACDTECSIQCSRPAFWSGRWKDSSDLPYPDPCGALIVKKELPPQREEKISFVLGCSASEAGLKKLVQDHLKPKKDLTDHTENQLIVKTPDPALNHMINTWLPWQTTASRIYGRTGFYQCGGAWGFRDQLQDTANLALLSPRLLKTHICRACASQFPEGDVLHWWHNLPGDGKKGVRTRYSDDLLWLVYAVCEYLEKTDDYSILDISVPFASAATLKEGEQEAYLTVSQSKEKDTVFNHCIRSIEKAYRLGTHGLVLMGCGDWNDGYNKVGVFGKGESVWLTQFLAYLMKRFCVVCERYGAGGKEYLENLKSNAAKLLAAVDEQAWDGEWYLRAYFDDGSRMGSSTSEECKIDSLPQSFSVISDMDNRERKKRALKSVEQYLVDWKYGIIKLFSPSFAESEQEPGYVKAYPRGLRENGGQYTHGAVWYAMAVLLSGDTETGSRLLQILNPAARYQNEIQKNAYQLEPYYMAADIYTNPNAYGRGGWSMYTGAAGWYYKTAVECLLGIRVLFDKVVLSPSLPKEWDGFSAMLKLRSTTIEITVQRSAHAGLYDNGIVQQDNSIPLDGGRHQILLNLCDAHNPEL